MTITAHYSKTFTNLELSLHQFNNAAQENGNDLENISSFEYISWHWINAWHFLELGFTPCKAEQPLQGMELQEKKL